MSARIRFRMEPLTIRIRKETKKSIDSEASEHGVSVSEHVRELIRKGREYDELRDRLEAREDRIEELEEQLARRSQIEDRVDELAIELREQGEAEAPFFVRWWQWYRDRD
jgi:TolA-binding protein